MTTRAKVLVVDDDPVVLASIQDRLEGAGFTVFTRDKPLGTTKVLMEERPDYLILDIRMPALSGDRLADVLRSDTLWSKAKIIFYTSQNVASLRELVRRTGALGAIAKTADDTAFVEQFLRLIAPH